MITDNDDGPREPTIANQIKSIDELLCLDMNPGSKESLRRKRAELVARQKETPND